MKISKMAYYGLRAVVALAHADSAISIHTLAESEQLPEDYLEKILQILRRARLVEATKGTAGGYALARTAQEISVWDVLRELDGPIKAFALPSPPAGGGTLPASNAKRSFAGWPCPPSSHCQTNQVWRTLETAIENSLEKISLADLIANNART